MTTMRERAVELAARKIREETPPEVFLAEGNTLNMANAAYNVIISTLMDPSEKMLEAGFAASGLDWADKRSDVLEVFQAMLKAATAQ